MSSYAVDEPIYALATAYQPSALAVIRASGEGSWDLLRPYFSGRLSSGKASHGYISGKDGKAIDEVVVVSYAKGHGYTSEEAFEIMSHGSIAVIKAISGLLDSIGFRRAERGEFTYRAFLHGRIDLTEAEAVEEIVSSRSDRARSDALSRLSGTLRTAALQMRDDILDILASLEVQLDYGEDEIPEDWEFPEERILEIISRLEGIASTYASSRLYSHGALVVLAGRANAGKSSLYNALLKEDRSIVSPEEGTTRDYIESDASIAGIPVRLVDTAGLRKAGGAVEAEGIRRTEEMMESADLIVYVLDGDEDDSSVPAGALTVRSKRDITGIDEGLSFSSVTGEGLDAVIEAIGEALSRDIVHGSDDIRIDSERQRDCLLSAASALREAVDAKSSGYDVIALFLQSSLDSLSILVGDITADDVLERLFSSFCLGK